MVEGLDQTHKEPGFLYGKKYTGARVQCAPSGSSQVGLSPLTPYQSHGKGSWLLFRQDTLLA